MPHARALGGVLALATAAALLALTAAPARAAESVEMEIAPAGDELFGDLPPDAQPTLPPPGQCLVIGRYSQFTINELSQVTVVAPDGRQVPLTVESASVFREFGHIAALRFCFSISRAEANPGNGGFTLRWGPGVRAANREVPELAPDPARRGDYRSLRLKAAGRFATLGVFADSTADYYFLWYLLPMALVFALLILGKVRARGSGDATAA